MTDAMPQDEPGPEPADGTPERALANMLDSITATCREHPAWVEPECFTYDDVDTFIHRVLAQHRRLTIDTGDGAGVQVISLSGPAAYVEGDDRQPIHDMWTTDLDTALHAGIAANRLGLGWAMTSHVVADNITDDREYHVVAWRRLVSEVGPMATEHINVAIKAGTADA